MEGLFTVNVPGDGNCLYNAVLVGYVAKHGLVPVLHGDVSFRAKDLREAVRKYYVNLPEQDRVDIVVRIIAEYITTSNYAGVEKKFEHACHAFVGRLTMDQIDIRDYDTVASNIDVNLVPLYIESVTTSWGGGSEMKVLETLLNTRIILVGGKNPDAAAIQLLYNGMNHFQVLLTQKELNIIKGFSFHYPPLDNWKFEGENVQKAEENQSMKASFMFPFKLTPEQEFIFLEGLYRYKASTNSDKSSITQVEVDAFFELERTAFDHFSKGNRILILVF
jgi:hypothetical protein